jgi:hypothetical protein
VLLTAVMVVVAGMPHAVCACAALPTATAGAKTAVPSSCGCCCAAKEAEPEATSEPGDDSGDDPAPPHCCCCRAATKPTAGAAADSPRLETAPCVQVLTPGEDLAPSPAKTTADPDVTPGAFLPPALPTGPHGPSSPFDHCSWQIHLCPPPTDLVTLLRHLLI